MSAIVVLWAGGSAEAQKKKPDLIGPPIRQNISVEDVVTGNFLVINAGTGEYTFTRCSDGLTISGVGKVKSDGCSTSLEDEQATHRVVASVNECGGDGKAAVERFTPEPFKLFFSDQNTGNNALTCPRPSSQSLSIQDDASGNFLVFDTGSGAYTFTRCSDGFTLSGLGLVKVDGCSISLEDVQVGHRVMASIDECTQSAKAVVQKFAAFSGASDNPGGVAGFESKPFKALLSDVNMGNNLLDCATTK
jgi:hypothetical protein